MHANKKRLLEICPIAVSTLEEAVQIGMLSQERMEKIFSLLVENEDIPELWLENVDCFNNAFLWRGLGILMGEDPENVWDEMNAIDVALYYND